MKLCLSVRRFAAAALLGTMTMTNACITRSESAPSGPGQKQSAELSRQKDFFLPEHIYAVPGVECNIYFRNIFLTINHDNYIFDVDGKIGRNDLKRWRYTPKKEDGGQNFPLTIRVFDRNGLAAEGKTTVHVAPADAGKGNTVSILMVGDSLTAATVYPTRLKTLCQGENNPELTMIGTHRGGGREALPGGVAHEGYGGWTWNTFLIQYKDPAKLKNPNRVQKFYARSKFLQLKDGKPVFDLTSYMKQRNHGKMPDVITFQLGVNDVFSATDTNLDQRIKTILNNADKLISAFRKEAPDALIGVGFVTPGAGQDGFGRGYQCGQTAWGYNRNQFRLNQAMATHFAQCGDAKLIMIPTQVNLDTENNFPTRLEPVCAGSETMISRQSNGVHPAPAGYNQMGDTFYAWLKNQLPARKSAAKQ